MHTTDYRNAFIEIAEDCPVREGTVPEDKREDKTVARLQYELLSENPYRFTSDEILFSIHFGRLKLPEEAREAERQKFFSKGQPCLRSSPLAKKYGWGFHFDAEGRVALCGAQTPDYGRFRNDPALRKLKAMRSAR